MRKCFLLHVLHKICNTLVPIELFYSLIGGFKFQGKVEAMSEVGGMKELIAKFSDFTLEVRAPIMRRGAPRPMAYCHFLWIWVYLIA